MAKKTSVRLMVPFSMHCTSCSHFIYKSTKFNARKTSTGEQYLGIAIFRFSIRCPSCGSEILFRTDPKTSGYVVLSGADRNLDPWHDKAAESESVEDRLARLAKQPNGSESDESENVVSREKCDVRHSAGVAIESVKHQHPGDAADASTATATAVSCGVKDGLTEDHAAQPQSIKPGISPAFSTPRVSKLPIPKRRKHLAKHS